MIAWKNDIRKRIKVFKKILKRNFNNFPNSNLFFRMKPKNLLFFQKKTKYNQLFLINFLIMH